ncbi:MAG: hypothetical protein AAB426_13560 [Myxococcota bacterium]
MQTKAHSGPLPDPISVLEKHLRRGGISLVHAAFENTFFVDPAAVREKTPYFPDRAGMSREHYAGKGRGDFAKWHGRKVRLGDNARAQMAWEKYTQRSIARRSGYGVRHIWGNPWDPEAFTGGWNLAYMPYWAGMLTEAQHRHEELERAIRQAAWELFFSRDAVCTAPPYVINPGLDLKKVLGGRPILLLVRQDGPGGDRSKPPSRAAGSNAAEIIKSIRTATNQSWSNLRKATLALQGRPHAPFGSANVAANSKSVVRRIVRETGIGLDELPRFLADRSVR